MNIFVKKIYNEKIESFSTRILYFFNSLDTYYLTAGLISISIYTRFNLSFLHLAIILFLVFLAVKIADLHPLFMLLCSLLIAYIVFQHQYLCGPILHLLLINIIIFVIIQALLMSVPDAIITRDPRVPFFVFFYSLFTIAPTTTSFLMSVGFATILSFLLYEGASNAGPYKFLNIPFWLLFFLVALISRIFKPKTDISKFGKLPIKKEYFRRVIVFNIDGCRLDLFKKLDLPNIRNLEKQGVSFSNGLTTIYRALTNPAFASILTGATPKYHRVINNNLGQYILTEGLPDIVPTILYGSMHIKHFSKKHWQTKIISLPTHSIYKSDGIMLEWLKNDLEKDKNTRLFIADFSEADLIGHSYSSSSKYYLQALQNIDRKIGEFMQWFENKEIAKDTAIIVCSDHGIYNLDHSYLFFRAEKYVPFIAVGKGIKKNFQSNMRGTIMDIGITIAYLLGCPYPSSSKGRVFTEILEDEDVIQDKDNIVREINRIFHDTIAKEYKSLYSEVYYGDYQWWHDSIKYLYQKINRPLNVLDFGCGTGFVGSVFKESQIPLDNLVCYDISGQMLKEAKNNLGQEHFSFQEDWNEIVKEKNRYDIITINSVLHHLYEPQKYISMLTTLLKPGGFIIGAHEPSGKIFQSKYIRLLASLFKLVSGKKISRGHLYLINARIKKEIPSLGLISEDDLLQTIDYHAPAEQGVLDINKDIGFNESDFKHKFFPNFTILKLERYSTFMYRGRIAKNLLLFNIFSFIYKKFIKSDTLFRYVVQKPKQT